MITVFVRPYDWVFYVVDQCASNCAIEINYSGRCMEQSEREVKNIARGEKSCHLKCGVAHGGIAH